MATATEIERLRLDTGHTSVSLDDTESYAVF